MLLEFATLLLPILLSLLVIFHLLIILKIIPYTIVWGSRLKTDGDMYRLEGVSLFMNLLFVWVALIKGGWLPQPWAAVATTVALWGMAVLFALNTLGNLASKNRFERTIFTPLTAVLTACCVILALH